MRKVLAVILSLFLVVAAAACSETKKPSDDEVLGAYALATEASYWFRMTSLPCIEPTVQQSGKTYYKVERFKSTGELKEYIATLFSDELVSEFMSSENYADIDGGLYTLDGGRGSDLTKGAETYAVVPKDDKLIILEVTVELLGDNLEDVVGSETHDFNYELKNGSWVFSSFPEVR